MTPKEIFLSLSGEWHLVRSLGEHGVIFGDAIFYQGPSEDLLLYREDFTIKNFHKNSLHSYQEYEYQYNQGKIVKYFKAQSVERRMFYELKFTCIDVAIATHLCNQDIYDVEYRFYSAESFKLIYIVKGPNKDYIIQTKFNKVS